MFACHSRHLFVENQSGARPWNFVGSDAHADAARTNQYSQCALAAGHALSNRLRILRIVAGLSRIYPEIRNGGATLNEIILERFLQLVTGMVRAQSDLE